MIIIVIKSHMCCISIILSFFTRVPICPLFKDFWLFLVLSRRPAFGENPMCPEQPCARFEEREKLVWIGTLFRAARPFLFSSIYNEKREKNAFLNVLYFRNKGHLKRVFLAFF